jgi:membrane associated rhomboid family serine protease
MGMFLFRYGKDDITCWFIRSVEVPAFLFILAFLAFDIAAFRHGDNVHVNYAAHFSGFIIGALYKLAFWKIFTTENPPEPKKRPVLGPSRAPARLPRR